MGEKDKELETDSVTLGVGGFTTPPCEFEDPIDIDPHLSEVTKPNDAERRKESAEHGLQALRTNDGLLPE